MLEVVARVGMGVDGADEGEVSTDRKGGSEPRRMEDVLKEQESVGLPAREEIKKKTLGVKASFRERFDLEKTYRRVWNDISGLENFEENINLNAI